VSRKADDYLYAKTGHDSAYWMARVQALINDKHVYCDGCEHRPHKGICKAPTEVMTTTPLPPKWKVKRQITKRCACKGTGAHQTTNTGAVIADLVKEIAAGCPETPHDGNMFIAAVLSAILGLWFARLQRAKSFDPVRPVTLRRQAYQGWLNYARFMQDALIDESADPSYFPKQRWQSPYDPNATSGDFR
jgi:hypothetical protein